MNGDNRQNNEYNQNYKNNFIEYTKPVINSSTNRIYNFNKNKNSTNLNITPSNNNMNYNNNDRKLRMNPLTSYNFNYYN